MLNKIFLRSPAQSLSFTKKENFQQENFLLSVYLSSSELYQEYLKKGSLSKKGKEKLERALYKYWIRSCSRCTPFATFAGCTLIELTDNEAEVILSDAIHHRKCARLDMNYMHLIVQNLLNKKEIRDQILFYPNNSIYEAGNVYRYVAHEIRNNKRNYLLISTDKTEYLTKLITKAKSGVTLPDLTQYLCELTDISLADAEAFIDDLYSSHVFIPEIEPAISGEDPLTQLILKIENIDAAKSAVLHIKQINDLLHKPKAEISHYQTIEQKIKELIPGKEEVRNFLQVDMFLSTQKSSINKKIIKKFLNQLDDLKYLARPTVNKELSNFITRFKNRYEYEEVPLVAALDLDLGIGYAGIYEDDIGDNRLIDDLAVYQYTSNPLSEMDYVREYVITKYDEYRKEKKAFIEIKEEELKRFIKQIESFKFSQSQFVLGSLMKKYGDEYFFELKEFIGASAAKMLGRFAYGDKQIENEVKALLVEEEKEIPDSIYAEIIHLPEARVGNVLLRPIFRNYEIPYVGKSGMDEEYQIKVDDLMISINNNEIVLRSKRYNKRVIPKLTTAHNFRYQSLPIYKFLCDLQYQGLANAGVWDWGELELLDYLPKVIYKDIILRKARWKISEEDFRGLPQEIDKRKEFIAEYRKKYLIPNQVLYIEGDNELLIDFETEIGLDLFFHYLDKFKIIILKECLFTKENSIVFDTEGKPLVNEILIPLTSSNSIVNKPANLISEVDRSFIKENFFPYSEWCYFKIYCGNKTAEKILSTTILNFVEKGIKENLFEKFFFIRFKDEFSHFRIRFYNTDISKQKEVFTALHDALKEELEGGIVDKIVLDTYKRELSRYHSLYIDEVENLFFSDSLAILRLIALLKEVEESDKYRFIFAFRGVDMLLNDFNYSLLEKSNLLKSISQSYLQEFGASPVLSKQLNKKYRDYQKDIFSHLDPTLDDSNGTKEGIDILFHRTQMNKVYINRSLNTDHFFNNRNMYLSSYIHMFLNRFFISSQRKYELVIYFFLDKYYNSQLAIQKN